MAEHDTVIVIAGGGLPNVPAAALPAGSPVVAADEGLEHAQVLGLPVDVAVGDFDSASVEAVRSAEATGTRIERHPEAKDATDLELALDTAASLGPRRILVLGPGGGRLDHLLAAVYGLAADRLASFEVDALLGTASVHVIRSARRFRGEPGELISLLPVQGPAEGVVTDGLAFPLRGETLEPGSSRGVSNVFAEQEASVSLRRGVLLAIRPGRRQEAP